MHSLETWRRRGDSARINEKIDSARSSDGRGGPPRTAPAPTQTTCARQRGYSTRGACAGGRVLVERGSVGGCGTVARRTLRGLPTVYVGAERVRVQRHVEGARDALAGDAALAGRKRENQRK